MTKPKWVVYKAAGGWAWRFEGYGQVWSPIIYETRASAKLAAKRAAQAEYDARLKPDPVLSEYKWGVPCEAFENARAELDGAKLAREADQERSPIEAMPEYEVEAEVTISVTKRIKARDRAEAVKAAQDLILPGIRSCDEGSEDVWDVDELDGEPRITKVSLV